ncbi:hypothetical protein C8R32_10230 [Nitrosospira sp. Nsp5]|uniref:Uncharacterized protein n=1 Tax=Nitrosospira multiformis TaxID=1231 RepID=A0ABY0TL90_9PROT|nr:MULTISPECIES: hypothetical protein [Nitrosospira]PTR09944.1 hypothetical protein C8R32_10230 [Nitrosospira sp. Nsp5]SDR00786.1 hypothetical protein SAMN05216402_3226 [Nitrosospira multiformis]
MIKFQPEWAKGMCDEKHVSGDVAEAMITIQTADVLPPPSSGIDYPIAFACICAATKEDFADHLDYILRELQTVRNNMNESKMADNPKCPACNRPAHKPLRAYDKKFHVVDGCVHAFHNGHLATNSTDLAFHNTPAAERTRATLQEKCQNDCNSKDD